MTATTAAFPANLARGYVKSFRSKWDNPVFQGDAAQVNVWSWLCDFAQADPYSLPTKYGTVQLQTGEILVSERSLADKFKLHRNTLRALLHRMTTEGMIEVFRDRISAKAGTIVRVVNYHIYQRLNDPLENGQDQSKRKPGPVVRPPQDQSGTKNNSSTYKKKEVDETRSVGVEGGLGETSFPTPAHPFALPGQLDLLKDQAPEAVSFVADPDQVVPDPEPDPVVLDPVPPEPEPPELAQPSVVITATFQPVAFTVPAPVVGTIPPDNVVQIAEHKRTRKKADPGRRWGPDEQVPPEWIEAGHRVRFQNGLPWADLEAEARRFARYWSSPDCPKPMKKDWKTTWLNWVDKPLSNQGNQHVQRHHVSAQGRRPPQRNAAMGALAAALEKHDDYPEDPGFRN